MNCRSKKVKGEPICFLSNLWLTGLMQINTMNLKVVFNKIFIELLCCGILSKTAMLFGDLYMKLFDCNLSHFDT